MTAITKKDIEKIAHLARLTISEQDISDYSRDLTNIIQLVEKINSAETENIEPMAHPLEALTQRLRTDEISEPNQRDLLQQNAPVTEDGVYLVPKVIDS